MPDAVKGGLFVGAAVAVGMLAGVLGPSLIDAGREAAKPQRAHASLLPKMPTVVGRPLDDAQGQLRRRGIRYVTDAPGIVEETVPGLLEVCESVPDPGRRVRGKAHLHTAIAGTCDI